MTDVESLRAEWTELYSRTLPALAKARDPAQEKWPVTLDHCFARIILDNTVGQGTAQWDKVIKKPAVRNMTEEQLKDAIELGEKIKKGDMDLRDLDEISLLCRGKNEGKYGKEIGSKKRKRDTGGQDSKKGGDEEQLQEDAKEKEIDNDLEDNQKPSKTTKKQSTLSFKAPSLNDDKSPDSKSKTGTSKEIPGSKTPVTSDEFKIILKQIHSHSSLTPYRKRLYTILLSVPRGRYTTYAAMSDYLQSSARAVGNGMRNNPFAPDVPCHRVLAADGSLGGFHGHWGREGKYANDKISLLRGEGIRFDGKGKVVGEPFRKFHEFEDWERT